MISEPVDAICVNLATLMSERNVTVAELAERVGLAESNIYNLKNGQARAIRFSSLTAICSALGCQPGDLLTFQESWWELNLTHIGRKRLDVAEVLHQHANQLSVTDIFAALRTLPCQIVKAEKKTELIGLADQLVAAGAKVAFTQHKTRVQTPLGAQPPTPT